MEIGLIQQAKILFLKEVKTEWRNRYAINGIIVQLVSAVFIVSLCFQSIKPMTWNALYWVILLFSAVNAIARSFIQVRHGRLLYYHSLVHPLAVLYSKMLFNSILSIVIAIFGYVVFSTLLGSVVADTLRFGGLALAFSVGVGLLFTVVSAIASKTKAGGIIMPLLSFPLIIPMILVTVTAGVFTVAGDYTDYTQNIAVITLINLMVTVIGTVVFRFLWQE